MSIFEEFEFRGIEKGSKIVEFLLEGVSASDIAKSVDLPVEQIKVLLPILGLLERVTKLI